MKTLGFMGVLLLSCAWRSQATTIPGLFSTGLGTACGSDPNWTAQNYASGNNGDGGALEAAVDLSPSSERGWASGPATPTGIPSGTRIQPACMAGSV
jgi:hypothetical protein